jgi:hypothetical protein
MGVHTVFRNVIRYDVCVEGSDALFRQKTFRVVVVSSELSGWKIHVACRGPDLYVKTVCVKVQTHTISHGCLSCLKSNYTRCRGALYVAVDFISVFVHYV